MSHGRLRPGRRWPRATAILVTLAFIFSACGVADSPRISSDTSGATSDEPATVDVAAAPRPITESERNAAADGMTGVEISTRGRLLQGASAVAPDAQGTIVAHAVAAQVIAYDRPDRGGAIVAEFDNPTDRGGPLVFAAEGRPTDGWLQVLLPIRPNGTTGWISVADVELSVNPYRIEVDASRYSLTVYRYGREKLKTTVAIGNGDTPTPIGEFFLIELLRPSNPDGAYGPYAYGLSGYSETLESFNGGNGVIGIHGTNQPDKLGQDVSHGCIRVANPTIAEMTEFLPLGTPVKITRDP